MHASPLFFLHPGHMHLLPLLPCHPRGHLSELTRPMSACLPASLQCTLPTTMSSSPSRGLLASSPAPSRGVRRSKQALTLREDNSEVLTHKVTTSSLFDAYVNGSYIENTLSFLHVLIKKDRTYRGRRVLHLSQDYRYRRRYRAGCTVILNFHGEYIH
jgi:hypothetical protein